MSLSRMMLFITIGIYLLSVGIMLSAIQLDITEIQFDANAKEIPQTDYVWNLPYNVSILPLWFNTIFLLVPFIAWIVILVSLFFPTGNAGS